jgi:nicotinate-nucleotide adenylyltransferase
VGFDRIRELAPPLVLGRAGVSGEDAPMALLPRVSSTEVRTLIGHGDWDTLANLVPRGALEHVRAHGLYGAPGSPGGEESSEQRGT